MGQSVRLILALASIAGSTTLFAQVPPLTITNSPPSSGYINVPFNFQFTASGGVKPYSWNWSGQDCGGPGCQTPPGLGMSTAGAVTGTPSQLGTFLVQVFVSDNSNNFNSLAFSISILPCAFSFNTGSTLSSADVGTPYSQAINITAVGCTPPYAFTAKPTDPSSQISLPPGLSVNPAAQDSSSAVISGTPTTANTYSFNVTVTEANKANATSPFSITVNPPLAIAATSPLPAATIGQAYSQSLKPSGGTPPYFAITLDNAPPGMTLDSPTGVLHGTPPKGSIGTYTFTATLIDSVKAQVSKQFQLPVVAAQPLLQITPTSLTFSAVAGGDTPPAQALSLAPATAAAASFTVLTDGGQPNARPPFILTVAPASGSAPAQLKVSVDQGSLQAGASSGRIRITDQNGSETDVAVNLSVSGVNAQLQAAPTVLRFAALVQSPGTFEQDLAITNTGGNGPAGFSVAALNGSSWISSVTPASGQTVRNSAVFARVLVNTQGLRVGSYSDTVRIKFSGGNLDVPVFLFVASSGAIVGTNVTGLRYQAQQGGGFSNAQAVKILNLGDPSTTINWTAKLVSGSDFVSLGATSGTATTSKPGALPVNLTANATQLSVGGHYALISITDPNAQNSPAYVVVVLDLAATGSPALPDPNPAGLYFVVVAGGAASAAQSVNVNTSSAQAVPFQVAPSTADGGAWLSLSQTSGQASGQNPGSFGVSVNPAGLKAGIYTGQASVSIGAAVRTVNVTVVVLPAGSTIPTGSSLDPARTDGAGAIELPRATTCTPSKLALTETGLVNNFSVPAKWPATLVVQLNDDCANAVSNGAVVASFSNGDSPVSLKNGGQGANYSATWQPGTTASQMVVTLSATAGTLPAATMQLVGGVAGNQAAAPVLAAGGTVNAFYRVLGGPLSPGTIVEMYGSGLGVGPTGTGAPPLPINFNGTSVLVGGRSAPLFYVSDGQLDVQIPSELTANQQYPILVTTNGAITLPDQLTVVPLQPTVDALTDGHLIAQHGADSSLVTADNPAKPGEAVVIYLLGMGPTSPSVPSGSPAPADPLAMVTAQPAITVDNQPASVFFAGLTPGFAGLYQVDFIVPTNARTGDLTVTISQNGVLTNTTTLPVAP